MYCLFSSILLRERLRCLVEQLDSYLKVVMTIERLGINLDARTGMERMSLCLASEGIKEQASMLESWFDLTADESMALGHRP